MDNRERANWRAKSAIIEWLVAAEQPKTKEDRVASILAWEQLPITELLEAKEYNFKCNAYRNGVLEAHIDVCIDLLSESKPTKKQRRQRDRSQPPQLAIH